MYPILLQIGPVTIYSLWICVCVGFLLSLLVLNKLIQKDRAKLSFIADNSLPIFLGGLLFSRLIEVIRNYKYYFDGLELNHILEIFYIWDKNLSFWGGVIGVFLTLAYFCKKERENVYKWFDILSVCIITGTVFGNLGAYLDGRNYGNETDLPWGIVVENSRFAVPIHPTQIYALIYCLLITIILFNLFNTKLAQKEGTISLITVASYSFFRFLEEFLRGDESNYFLWLREAQIYCLIALIASLVLLYKRFFQKKIVSPTI